jgi:hypothetical protein
MSGTNRTLKINPALFFINGKSKKEKKRTIKARDKRPIDEENSSKSKHLQKALINKVKDFQKNKEIEAIKDEKNLNEPLVNELFEKNKYEDVDFEREFDKSLNFLHDLSLKNKYKKKNKQTIKNKSLGLDINLELPSNLEKTDAVVFHSYSSLKNGSRPTYRELNKTKKYPNEYKPSVKIVLENNKYDTPNSNGSEITPQKIVIPPLPIDRVIPPLPIDRVIPPLPVDRVLPPLPVDRVLPPLPVDRVLPPLPVDRVLPIEIISYPEDNELKINKPIKNLGFTTEIDTTNDIEIIGQPTTSVIATPPIKQIPKINRVTRKSIYKLGKHKNKRTVGVLIKNNKTQKNIKSEITALEQKSIKEIKSHLRDKNLIKAGSDAPNDVIRTLYNGCVLSGDVNNINSDNLVYNYLNI